MADRHLVAGMGKDIERYNARLRQKYDAIVQVCCAMDAKIAEELRKRGLTAWRLMTRKLLYREGEIPALLKEADAYGTINFFLVNHKSCLDLDSACAISRMLQKNARNVRAIHVESAGKSALFTQIYPLR